MLLSLLLLLLFTCICTHKRTKCQVPLRPLLGKQNIQAKEVYTSQSSATRKPGGTQQMFIRGGSAPRTNPLPFIYHFNRCKCTVFQITINHILERFPTFSSHKIHLLALLGSFTDLHDRFPYPSINFN